MALLHLDFSDFEPLVQDVRSELPGVINRLVAGQAAKVVAEFCEYTHCFRERIELPPGDMEYELVSPHPDAAIIGVARVRTAGGNDLLPGDYEQVRPSLIELADKLPDTTTVTVVLKPLETASRMPTFMLNRWRSQLAKGIKSRLMLQTGMEWSNAQLGATYRNNFASDMRQARADCKNEFSVTRRGRTPYKMSAYY